MYNISTYDLLNMQKRHDIQRKYLEDEKFITFHGEEKSLLDVSYSANHSIRYYGELTNKINTMNTMILSDVNSDYDANFLTITLDGYFRDFLKGNFKRYNESKHKAFIPNNDTYGFLRDKIANKEKFTIKNLYKVLCYQVKRFQSSSPYRKVKKQGIKIHYIKVTEPHKKDGVPHMHLMLYVPIRFRKSLLEAFKAFFPAPRNLKKIVGCDDGQIKGFQWNIRNREGYILKYVQKSFMNVKEQDKLDHLQSWYIKHKILRVVTSHSLVPAWIYRKISILESDWHYLCDIKNHGYCEWSNEDKYFKFVDEQNYTLEYCRGLYTYAINDRILKQFGEKKESTIKDVISLKYKKKEIKAPEFSKLDYEGIGLYEPNKEHTFNGFKIIPSKLKDYQLIQYYYKLKISSDFDIRHFTLTKNEMIKRGFLRGLTESLNIEDIKYDF